MNGSTLTTVKTQAQAVRGVGCKRGYPYFATGLYRVTFTRAGRMVWRLVKSGDWYRSTRLQTCGAFSNAVHIDGVRHNGPVTAEQLAALRAA